MSDETNHPKRPGSNGGNGAPPARDIYDLEPEAPPRAGDAGSPPPPAARTPPAKVGEESVLAGFDEDADFEKDPEVEMATKGAPLKKKPAKGAPREVAPGAFAGPDEEVPVDIEAVSRPGKIPAKHLAIAAGVGVIAAAVLAGVFAASKPFANAVATAYMTLLVSLLGLAGVAMAAALLSKPIGAIEHAASRMFFATSLAAVILHIKLNTPGRILEITLAVAAYYLAVWVLFRLKPIHALAIACCHASLGLLMYVGMALTSWANQVGTSPVAP